MPTIAELIAEKRKSDAAGQKAALRLLPIGLREGLDIRFLSLPGGKDPDEYFSTHDAAGWAGLVAGARSAMQFCVQSLVPEGSVNLPLTSRLSLLEAIFPIVEQAGAEEIVREALNASVSARCTWPTNATGPNRRPTDPPPSSAAPSTRPRPRLSRGGA